MSAICLWGVDQGRKVKAPVWRIFILTTLKLLSHENSMGYSFSFCKISCLQTEIFKQNWYFFLRSLLCGELSHHGQFVSPVVILEWVIPNSHCFFSPKCWNPVDCGNLVQDSGPQSWARAQSHGCTGPMRHCSDLSDLRDGGLGKRYLDFLLDYFWNTCKITINNQQDFVIYYS